MRLSTEGQVKVCDFEFKQWKQIQSSGEIDYLTSKKSWWVCNAVNPPYDMNKLDTEPRHGCFCGREN